MNRLQKLRCGGEAGFTVVEALIAAGLTLMFIAMCSSVLTTATKSEQVLSAKHDALMTEIFLNNYISSQFDGEQVGDIEVVSPACDDPTVMPEGLVMPATPNCVMVSGYRFAYVITVIDHTGFIFTRDTTPIGYEPARRVEGTPSFIPPEGMTAKEFWSRGGR